jgi:hypothetical protein
VENSWPKTWAISENFAKLPKENNRTMGENSPNLVTLKMTWPSGISPPAELWVLGSNPAMVEGGNFFNTNNFLRFLEMDAVLFLF